MSAVFPIPTNRISNQLFASRLTGQLQSDQADFLRLQDQISTGRRIRAPSEDAPAALRAVDLQRILEQKLQVRSNVTTGQSFLSATDQALTGVAGLVSDVRSIAVQFADNTHTDVERSAAVAEVRRALERLVGIGNQQFRDRYLFSGSRTATAPFRSEARQVVYDGNATELQNVADVDVLFESNVPGSAVFGGTSAAVKGTIDLNPRLSEATRLDDLRGGAGVTRGSFIVSDGQNSSVVDIRRAATIGDVARLIEANPPAGRTVRARVTDTGLTLDLDDGSGALIVREIEGGATASELGIANPTGAGGTAPLVGRDLDPLLRLTTSLADVLGTRARAYVDSPGDNNDLVLTAKVRGPAANGFRVQVVDSGRLQAGPGLSAGYETVVFTGASDPPVAARAALPLSGANNDLILTATTPGAAFNGVSIVLETGTGLGNSALASYSAAAKTLTIRVDDADQTTVGALAAAVNATGVFTASADPSNGEGFNPAAIVLASDAGVLSGHTGNSGADPRTIQVFVEDGESTAAQVLAALQADPSVTALFDVALDDTDTSSSAFAGTGYVDAGAATTLAGGSGVEPDLASGLQITNGGATHTVTFGSAETVEDLLNALNGSSAQVIAEINASRTGIDVRSRVSGQDFAIGENGGATAAQLGLRSLTESTRLSELRYGLGVATYAGTDFTIRRPDGVDLAIDVDGATTIGDVLDRINTAAGNVGADQVTARLATFGNGIELTVATPTGAGQLTVLKHPSSLAAEHLGLVATGQTQTVAAAGTQTITGTDPNPREAEGIFNAVLRLSDAIGANDAVAISRAASLLDEAFDTLNFSRAELGARGQSLDILQSRLDDEEVQLRASLSEEIDTDLVEALSELVSRQTAYEASLRLVGNVINMSLIDFL